MASSPEHRLQIAIKKWVRECVITPHVFLAFDRTRKTSAMQHIAEAARGVRAGTPDTVLLLPDGKSIWVELKWGKNTTSDRQDELHGEMRAIGHPVVVCRSVDEYACLLDIHHVTLSRLAMEIAAGLDRALIAAAPVKKARRSSPRAPKPRADAARIAATHRAQAKGTFSG